MARRWKVQHVRRGGCSSLKIDWEALHLPLPKGFLDKKEIYEGVIAKQVESFSSAVNDYFSDKGRVSYLIKIGKLPPDYGKKSAHKIRDGLSAKERKEIMEDYLDRAQLLYEIADYLFACLEDYPPGKSGLKCSEPELQMGRSYLEGFSMKMKMEATSGGLFKKFESQTILGCLDIYSDVGKKLNEKLTVMDVSEPTVMYEVSHVIAEPTPIKQPFYLRAIELPSHENLDGPPDGPIRKEQVKRFFESEWAQPTLKPGQSAFS